MLTPPVPRARLHCIVHTAYSWIREFCQVKEERQSSPTLFRSKSDGKQHHAAAAERHTIGCPDDAHRPSPRQEDSFQQMFRAERGVHCGRGVDSEGPAGVCPSEGGPGREPRWDAHGAKAVYQRLYTHARNRETRRKEREEQKERQEVSGVCMGQKHKRGRFGIGFGAPLLVARCWRRKDMGPLPWINLRTFVLKHMYLSLSVTQTHAPSSLLSTQSTTL